MRRQLLVALLSPLLMAAACQRGPEPVPPGEAEAFLAQNKTQPGVRTTSSGLQYKVVRAGPVTGARPRPGDTVKVHYEGKLPSGEVFDSSYQQGTPAVFTVGELVPGWNEALQLMRPGDELQLWVPPELGYGAEGIGPIPGNSVLVFRMELLGVLPQGGSVGQG
ncbi:MAG: FKBP-type peptidyl-prolyl cis-trans isomerase [Pseudomonadota bacterium]|nr:FKBP-type peptidyl-prolyl cis-trans isomerase [Pseudomonadota bacterium]